MKKDNQKNSLSAINLDIDEMLEEYDFAGKIGVRGKYYQDYRKGHRVQVTHTDGTISTQHFTLDEGAVFLEPDVRASFSSQEAVNEALRLVMRLAKTVD